MAYFKIKNITNTLGKRDSKLNSAQIIKFKDNISSTDVVINSGIEIVVESAYLPASAQKLRTEGLITVVEIDKNTYQKLLNAQNLQIIEENNTKSVEPAKTKESEDKSKKNKKVLDTKFL